MCHFYTPDEKKNKSNWPYWWANQKPEIINNKPEVVWTTGPSRPFGSTHEAGEEQKTASCRCLWTWTFVTRRTETGWRVLWRWRRTVSDFSPANLRQTVEVYFVMMLTQLASCSGSLAEAAATLMRYLQKTVTFTFSLLPVVQITRFINSYCFLDEQRKDVCLSVGFSTVAINYTFEPAAKAKQVTSNRQLRSREQWRLF